MGKDVSIRELHEKTGQMVDQAAEGQVIVIKRRGKPVAELRAYAPAPKERSSFMARFKKDPKIRGDSGRVLEDDRR